MDFNQIIIIIIVILLAIITTFVLYGLIKIILHTKNKNKQKQFDNLNIVEEESLLNVMDEKINIEHSNKNEEKRFVNENINVDIIPKQQQEEKVNPFGVNLSNNTNKNFINDNENKKNNKFIV